MGMAAASRKARRRVLTLPCFARGARAEETTMDAKPPADNPFPTPAFPPRGGGAPREPRSLDVGQALGWWSEGWQVFMAAPVPWLLIAVAVLVAAALLLVVPFFGAIVLTILAPVVAGGVALGCRKLARGEPLAFADAFSAFRGDTFLPLALVGVFALLANAAVSAVLGIVLFVLVGGAGFAAALSGFGSQAGVAAMATMGLGALVLVPIAIAAFALVSMCTWLAPALVVLSGRTAVDALKGSFAACMRNLGPVVVYAIVFLALAIVAAMPFGLGLVVFGPVAAGSWFAAWRTLYGD